VRHCAILCSYLKFIKHSKIWKLQNLIMIGTEKFLYNGQLVYNNVYTLKHSEMQSYTYDVGTKKSLNILSKD